MGRETIERRPGHVLDALPGEYAAHAETPASSPVDARDECIGGAPSPARGIACDSIERAVSLPSASDEEIVARGEWHWEFHAPKCQLASVSGSIRARVCRGEAFGEDQRRVPLAADRVAHLCARELLRGYALHDSLDPELRETPATVAVRSPRRRSIPAEHPIRRAVSRAPAVDHRPTLVVASRPAGNERVECPLAPRARRAVSSRNHLIHSSIFRRIHRLRRLQLRGPARKLSQEFLLVCVGDERLERRVEWGRVGSRLGATFILAMIHRPDESSHDVRRVGF
mmetsp:Transcript_6455/g.26829  ORF Transcript_6455/g.26829 Transcript_6455/m.26829 type:complete len:284 (+) Transcript_6455:670-1521(+)